MLGDVRLEVARLNQAVPGAILATKEHRGDTWVAVGVEHLEAVLTFLRDDPELEYTYFVECVGADYSTWEHARDLPGKRFEVVYNLVSPKLASRLFVKVGVNDGEAIPTMKDVYLGAEYPEKEIGDLYGIKFSGNELVKGERFLLPDDWIGFPLRKEVPLGGEDVLFDQGDRGPAVEDVMRPHAGESFEGKTGSEDVSGR